MPDRQTPSKPHVRGAAGDWPGPPGQARATDPSVAQAKPSDETAAASVSEAEVERLRAELEAAQAQAAEHLATLQRTAADFANYRRRTAEDRERELGLASESLLRKLLAVADDFDRALDAMPEELRGVGWIEGVVLLDRKLRALLESEGVTPIESVGKAFDPREHEAVVTVPGSGRPDGEIVAEMQRGYRVRDRVLRPAMVAVAGDGAAASGDANEEIN
jgi:molecular chaperone GrpE